MKKSAPGICFLLVCLAFFASSPELIARTTATHRHRRSRKTHVRAHVRRHVANGHSGTRASKTQSLNPPALATDIESILAAPAVSHAHWGISVVDDLGKPLYSLNEGQFFAPASNAKLFTTAAAFALLGPDFVSKTYLVREGPVDAQGRLAGAMRLIGTGDPSISGRTYPYTGKTERPDPPLHVLDDLANQVAAAGIRQIDGPIIGDDTFFPAERYGSGWGWDDLQWGYGAPVSALTVNENVVYLNIFPASRLGDMAIVADSVTASRAPATPATVPPGTATGCAPNSSCDPAIQSSIGPYLVQNEIITTSVGATQQVGVDRPTGDQVVRLYGSIPLDSNGVHLALAIDRPAEYAATVLHDLLIAHGVKLLGTARGETLQPKNTRPFEDRVHEPLELHALTETSLPLTIQPAEQIVAVHTSPTLAVEATVINKVSQNLHAELLLRQLGKSQTGEGSFVQGVRVVRQFLINAGLSPDDFILYDGSGLSSNDQVTPRSLTALLVYAARQPWGAAWRATLPIGGVDGTLSARFLQSPLKGQIFAKTGTLAEVNTISGYLTAASGRTIAFSILCNGRRPSSDAERKAMDRVAELIAAAE